jgi:GAF domain-containing protein/DNA-binding NarL/FixJ family response regulator
MLNSTLKNARLLIIDDQESNIALLESVLEREGYTDLKSTIDSRQASTLYDEFQPDLILLDLRMPHFDGFAVMEQLRERILGDGYVPVLVLTADVTPETKLRALAVCARDFLTKPVDVAEVSLRIHNLLETRYLHLQQKNQNQILEQKIRERTAELRQRVEDLALINALNAAINRGDDLQKIIALMADELHRIFHCIGTMTAFLNPDKQSLHIAHIEFPVPLASQIEKLAGASLLSLPLKIPISGVGQFAQVLRAGQPEAINDAETIKAVMAEYTENKLLKSLVAPVYKTLGIGSMLLIPLISGTEIYGLLEMARTEATSAAELARVQSIAGQLTSAIGRRRAEEETTLKNKQLTMLNHLGQALNKLASIPEILERTSKLIGQVFDNRNLYIALYDEASNFVSFPIYWMAGERKNSLEGRPLGSGLTELVIRTRAPVLISDNVREALADRGVALIGTMSKCYLGVPLLVDERLIGVIAVQDYEHENVYNSNHVELLSTIASQTAIAIENANLYETSQKELTARKQAEAENTRMAMALDIAPSAITVHGFDGHFLYANQELQLIAQK